jgi:hypothetical protein
MGNIEKVHGRVAASGKGLEAPRKIRAIVSLVEEAPPPEFYPVAPICNLEKCSPSSRLVSVL